MGKTTNRLLLGTVVAMVASQLFPLGASGAAISYYVSPSGSDSNDGSTPERPLRSIQRALDKAQPGSTVRLASGTYLQDTRSVRDGTVSAPITITGPSDAVVKGAGQTQIVKINHDNHVLQGFTLDGHFGSGSTASSYRKKLLYAQGVETRSGVSGLRVLGMTLTNALDECIRLRYFAEGNEVAGSTITDCGIEDFQLDGGGKNGEGIYIGTAPEQLGDGNNPTTDRDLSRDNFIHDNFIDTQGGECVDVKEAASANLIENNRCTGSLDPDGGGLNSRGHANVFRSNEVYGHVGAGIRLGGDKPDDAVDNSVYDNVIRDNQVGGIKFMATPQAKVCGNTMSGNGRDTVGTFGGQFDPTKPCGDVPGEPTTTTTSALPPTTSTTTSTSTTIPATDPQLKISESFSSSAATSNFNVVSGGRWKVSRGDYVLADPNTSAEVGNGNISVHKVPVAGDFTMTSEGRTKATSSPFNDFSVLFSYRDPDNYCFVSFNESNDENTSGVFSVDDGTLREITDIPSTIKANVDYDVKIEKDGFRVTAYRNGDEMATVEAPDCGGGQVGFGTRNDSARFDNLQLQ
jgi:hypothetical protein